MDKRRSESASPHVGPSKEQLLARATLLLQKSQNQSAVTSFQPITMRNVKKTIDIQNAKLIAGAKTGQESIQGTPMIQNYPSTIINPSQADPQPHDQTCPPAVGQDLNGTIYPVLDDGAMSLRSFDSGKPKAARLGGRGSLLNNGQEGRFSDIPEGVDMSTNILLTYFLHALEIERLVTINRELVSEGQEMENELTLMDSKMEKVEAERVEFTNTHNQFSLAVEVLTGKVKHNNLPQASTSYFNEPVELEASTKAGLGKLGLEIELFLRTRQEKMSQQVSNKIEQQRVEVEERVKREETQRFQQVILNLEEQHISEKRKLEKTIIDLLKKIEDMHKDRKKELMGNIQNIVHQEVASSSATAPTQDRPVDTDSSHLIYQKRADTIRRDSSNSQGLVNVYSSMTDVHSRPKAEQSKKSSPIIQPKPALRIDNANYDVQQSRAILTQTSGPLQIGQLTPSQINLKRSLDLQPFRGQTEILPMSESHISTLLSLGSSIVAASAPQQNMIKDIPFRNNLKLPQGGHSLVQQNSNQQSYKPPNPFVDNRSQQNYTSIYSLHNTKSESIPPVKEFSNTQFHDKPPEKTISLNELREQPNQPTLSGRNSYTPFRYKPLSKSGNKIEREGSIDASSVISRERRETIPNFSTAYQSHGYQKSEPFYPLEMVQQLPKFSNPNDTHLKSLGQTDNSYHVFSLSQNPTYQFQTTIIPRLAAQGESIVIRSQQPKAIVNSNIYNLYRSPLPDQPIPEKPSTGDHQSHNLQAPNNSFVRAGGNRAVYQQAQPRECLPSTGSDMQSRSGTGSLFPHQTSQLQSQLSTGIRSAFVGGNTLSTGGLLKKASFQRMSKEYTPVLTSSVAMRVERFMKTNSQQNGSSTNSKEMYSSEPRNMQK